MYNSIIKFSPRIDKIYPNPSLRTPVLNSK